VKRPPLIAAARRPQYVSAVICRSGLPDLAEREISQVRSPTLLIVGGEDKTAVTSNRRAYELLRCQRDLLVVRGAGHLLDEPTSVELTNKAVLRWLDMHVKTPR